jgi:hypothetical protein
MCKTCGSTTNYYAKGVCRQCYNAEYWLTHPQDKQIITYAVYDVDTLVYVARTDNWYQREKAHRSTTQWWSNDFLIITMDYPTYGDSLVAEAIMIRDKQPKYNAAGVTR